MKRIATCLLSLLLPMASLAAEPAATATLVPPAEKIFGRSQAEWSGCWWQWAASFEDEDSPVADRTGTKCHLGQEGEVWFLAGTYGTQRTIRKCTVPAGKYLFFPLINSVIYPREGFSLSCGMAMSSAARETAGVSSLVLEVDGKLYGNLQAYRQATVRCFDLAERAGGGLEPAAGNGYYIMLRPLSPGTHTINFGGVLPDMSQAVTYTLLVK